MKLELYKPYRTRSGHKAVVVAKICDDLWQVFNCERGDWWYHAADGRCQEDDKSLDLILEWHEPRTGEFWVNVYEDEDTSSGLRFGYYEGKDYADKVARGSGRIAIKKITWTEGDEE